MCITSYQFGQVIADQGSVVKIYENPIFNHPPLLGTYLGFAYEWAGPKEPLFREPIFGLPGIAAGPRRDSGFALVGEKADWANPPGGLWDCWQ